MGHFLWDKSSQKLEKVCRELCIFWVRFRVLTCTCLEIKHAERPPPANNNASQKHTEANCTPQSNQKVKVFDWHQGILHKPGASYLTHQTSHAAARYYNRACCRRMGVSMTGWYVPCHLPLCGCGAIRDLLLHSWLSSTKSRGTSASHLVTSQTLVKPSSFLSVSVRRLMRLDLLTITENVLPCWIRHPAVYVAEMSFLWLIWYIS